MSKYKYEIELSKNDGHEWTTTRVCLIAKTPGEAVDKAVVFGKEPDTRFLNLIPKIISCEELVGEDD